MVHLLSTLSASQVRYITFNSQQQDKKSVKKNENTMFNSVSAELKFVS